MNMDRQNARIRMAAAAITFVLAALIVVLLLHTHLGAFSTEDAAYCKADTIPEQEEIFLDPVLEDIGDPEIEVGDEPAAAPEGEPEQAQEDNDRLQVKDDKLPKEPVKEPKPVTQKQDSKVKVKPTANSDKENKRISSKMGNAFNPHNGKKDGKKDGSGSGKIGIGVSGLQGRKRLTDPSFSEYVDKEVTIKVRIAVNEAGKVTEASFVSDSGPGAGNKTLRSACIKAARNIKWSKKKGTSSEAGVLTFRLTPPKGK